MGLRIKLKKNYENETATINWRGKQSAPIVENEGST